jgi:hypothetical protein
MSGAIPPLPSTHSWHGAQLKHRDNFTFTFTFIIQGGSEDHRNSEDIFLQVGWISWNSLITQSYVHLCDS